ncbi:MAG: DUF2891 domain-containing protein [Pseudomonadales bacterium]
MNILCYRIIPALSLLLLCACSTSPHARNADKSATPVATQSAALSDTVIGNLASLALQCVHQEYPNVLLHQLASDADAQPPRQLHPAFYGCYDWHSSVHGHWLLARIAHLYPDTEWAPAAREALFVSLTKEHLDVELQYLRAPGRKSFERPYGLAWLLQLDRELGDWAESGDALADNLKANIAPLVQQSAEHLLAWLPKLSHPVRSGTHGQTAFALGLFYDWAAAENATDALAILVNETRRLYLRDENCPLAYEPSGHDFLSACIAEADLLRRILPAAEFSRWLSRFLPQIPVSADADWLAVASVTDPTDGHLVHLDGLNLSRAWMLEGIAVALPGTDARRPALQRAAQAHSRVGMASISDPHYAGGHWLGSFATYLVTRRGITQQ